MLNYGAGRFWKFPRDETFSHYRGGAVVVNSDLLAERVRELTRFGQIMVGGQKVIGINAKLSEVHAAMGLAILDEIEIVIEKRRRIYDFYSENLKGNFQLQFISTEIKYNYAYFPLLFNSISALEACIKLEKNGIYPRRYFYPSLERHDGCEIIDCPIADRIANRIYAFRFTRFRNLKRKKDLRDC